MAPASTTNRRIYLDYNASAPLAKGVQDAMLAALNLTGNPSSPHAEGREASRCLEESRRAVGACIGADALDVVFTSGGTEANQLALIGLARSSGKRRVLLPPTVHPSLWAAGEFLSREGFALETLRVDARGRIDQQFAAEALAGADVAAMGFSLANHELGTIEEPGALVSLAQRHGTLLFCDAVQALGRLPIDVGQLGVDGLALSAHKVGGPEGIGALWLAPGPDVSSIVGGGKQESGRRPGTQAVSLIAGFAAAVSRVPENFADCERQAALRDRISVGLSELGAAIHSSAEGLCNTVCARFPGVPGDLLVSSLDLAGIAVSTGAACSSGTTQPSPGLLGIGLSESQALEAIRVSFGSATTATDVEALLELLPPILERAKRFF